jgi:hypothetical protein
MSWKDEPGTQVEARTPSERALAVAPSRPQLFVVLDCARPDGASRHDLGDVDEVRIGRGADRSARRTVESEHVRVLELTLPDPLVSLEHARIVARDDGWTLEDVGARNGTWVDGACVPRARSFATARSFRWGARCWSSGPPCPRRSTPRRTWTRSASRRRFPAW